VNSPTGSLGWVAAFILAVFSLSPLSSIAQAPEPSNLARARMSHLQHGVNASQWFAQVYDPKGYTKEHFETWTTAQDIALIQPLGFDHVRLSIDPRPMFQSGHADELPADYLAYIDAAVKMIVDHKLAVIIDIHPDSDFKARLSNDDFVEQFADFWRALAKHFSTTDPDMVFLEMLNEPEMKDRYRWYGIEAKLATAIREGAPRHTIIVTGAQYSADDELLFINPLRDPNLIYSFHFYQPEVFTHQGATWAVNFWHELRGVPYPSNPQDVNRAAQAVTDPVNRLYLTRYGAESWGPDRVNAEIGQVAAWAKRWNVPVICDEFGVYKKYAPPEDRLAWMHDVRSALEKNGMGWTVWDYSGGFGIVTKTPGQPQAQPDPAALKALGLSSRN